MHSLNLTTAPSATYTVQEPKQLLVRASLAVNQVTSRLDAMRLDGAVLHAAGLI